MRLPDAFDPRNLAGAARRFSAISSSVGSSAPRVSSLSFGWYFSGTTGSPGGAVEVAPAAKTCLTRRSSSEWYESTAIRPPTAIRSTAAGMARSRPESSPLTSIRRAWKVRFAGLPPVRLAAWGRESRMSSTSRALLLKGAFSRSRTMADTIRLACFSSPYWRRIRTSSPGA